MAGIGFELRKMLRQETLAGLLKAYGLAGIISSGPWVMSMLGMTLVEVLWKAHGQSGEAMARFKVSVTYLISASLILTGFLQLLLARFISDRIFEKRHDLILPNLLGAISLTTVGSGLFGGVVLLLCFTEPWSYRVLMLASFVTLCDMWIVVVMLSGLRAVRPILWAFVVGYGVSAAATLVLRPLGLCGLLLGFLLGHGVLLFFLLGLVLRAHPSERLVAFDFLARKQAFWDLSLCGFVYNLSAWLDKFVFWFNPHTSHAVVGPLRASLIYDIPASLSYISIIPGMAVFILRIETDFVERHDRFYTSLRQGDTLERIEGLKDDMVRTIRRGLYEVLKVQGLAVLGLVLSSSAILSWVHVSGAYVYLFCVDVISVGIQVLLMCVINVFFYFDERRLGLLLCATFAVLNLGLTLLTQHLGPYYYGYGLAVAVTLTSLLGLGVLSWKLDRLEYETFMLQ